MVTTLLFIIGRYTTFALREGGRRNTLQPRVSYHKSYLRIKIGTGKEKRKAKSVRRRKKTEKEERKIERARALHTREKTQWKNISRLKIPKLESRNE